MNCYWYAGFDEAEKAAALLHARLALADPTDSAYALAIAAAVVTFLNRDYDTALSAINRALSQNPSSATAHYVGAIGSGLQRQFRGRGLTRRSRAAAESF